MPTKRGWQMLMAAAALCGAGRLLGIRELFEFGMLLILLVVVAVASVVRRSPKLSLTRIVANPRPNAHCVVRINLKIHNPGRRASPSLLYVENAPDALGGRTFVALRPLQGGKTRSIDLKFNADRRGVYQLGPGILSKTDPFGLAHSIHASIDPARIVVYPVTEDIDLFEIRGDSGPGSRSRVAHATDGREFYALRQFQEGDDQRRIHWPSTARLGRTMIRQEEHQSHSPVTVLIDPAGASASEYERCICSAASVVRSFLNRRHPTRLVDGPSTSRVTGTPESYHQMMDRLARSFGDGAADTSYLWRELGKGFNVVVCARPHAEMIRRFARDRNLASRTLVIAHRSGASSSDDGRIEATRRTGAITLEIPPTARLGGVWKMLWAKSPVLMAR